MPVSMPSPSLTEIHQPRKIYSAALTKHIGEEYETHRNSKSPISISASSCCAISQEFEPAARQEVKTCTSELRKQLREMRQALFEGCSGRTLSPRGSVLANFGPGTMEEVQTYLLFEFSRLLLAMTLSAAPPRAQRTPATTVRFPSATADITCIPEGYAEKTELIFTNISSTNIPCRGASPAGPVLAEQPSPTLKESISQHQHVPLQAPAPILLTSPP